LAAGSAHNRHLCHGRRSGWVGLTGGQVEGLAGAEGHAFGVVLLGLLLAQVSAHLVEAVLEVARFEFLPRLSGLVEDGLRGAVQQGRPVPVGRVGGQA